MEQIIYGDVLFAVNFSMDFLALYATGRLTHERMRPAPLMLGASIGAVYGVAALFVGPRGFFGWLINTAVAAVMCLASYERSRPSLLLRRVALFYGTSFLLGGVMTALYNLLNGKLGGRAVVNGGLTAFSASLRFPVFAGLATAAAAAVFVIERILRKRRLRRDVSLTITVGDRSVELSALCDSGNLATEPLGGLPVVFVDRKKLRRLLSGNETEFLRSQDPARLVRAPSRLAKRTRAVPIHTVAGSRTELGFLPDGLFVDGAAKEACVVMSDAPFGTSDALVPESLVD